MKDQLLNRISEIATEVSEGLSILNNPREVQELKVKYLGKKGKITELMKQMGTLSKEERPVFGKKINQLKNYIETSCKELAQQLEAKKEQALIEEAVVDVTLPPRMIPIGKVHPITKILNELIEVFTRMGFSVYEGPDIETDWYNFEALNVPKDHPARDMQDTFYIDDERLLRTHTSPVQIRVMESGKPPIFMIGPGTAYRRDTPDLTHSPIFKQVEGLMVDENITFSDLRGVLTEFIHKVFGEETNVRFRPSFFPFTEPSAEMEIECVICKGGGCRVCKDTGWIEILGCGMVDPAVFEAVGYDPKKYTGFAFGMGVERITMLKYNIHDIRLFYENNLKFLDQF